jgi:Zn-dependent protease with chaperone function
MLMDNSSWSIFVFSAVNMLTYLFFLQYLECEADKKPSQLVDLLVKNKSKKIIM